MSFVAITLTLTLTFGGGQLDQAYLDVNPVFAVRADYGHLLGGIMPSSYASGFAGTTVGNVIFVNGPVLDAAVRRDPGYGVQFWREEVEHTRQWSALGPFFPALYLVSRGQPFEPYPARDLQDYRASQYDFAAMWHPTRVESERCPAIRLGLVNHGTSLYPCWRF
ncbi:MAG TPA: hypothetical protein VKA00_02230 [Trueperaceae bacterium]|nr:hypothetical protein [Trueperaceae bacterium]